MRHRYSAHRRDFPGRPPRLIAGVGNHGEQHLPVELHLVGGDQRVVADVLRADIVFARNIGDDPLIAIDQVGLGEGDFIDIGLPVLDGRAVPLSIKTLVFYD